MKSDIYSIDQLSWDSDFFECKVGQLNIEHAEFDIEKICQAGLAQNINLLYLFLDKEITDISSNYNVELVDQKVTYHTNLKAVELEKSTKNIFSYPLSHKADKQLINLSIIAGSHSRFNVDPIIPNAKFEALYQKWIENSVSRKFANEVLVYKENEKDILGMITIKLEEQTANIGLLSVLPNQRGKGIGSALINAALTYISSKGIEQVKLVTQRDNIHACNFYEKNNFTKKSLSYIYHFWLS